MQWLIGKLLSTSIYIPSLKEKLKILTILGACLTFS
jgi:hypothetical protein